MIGRKLLHYEISAKLGEGGMGVVYRARDTRLKRDVAIKFLPTQIIGDAIARRRFETEAGAAAALSHPNIAHVYAIENFNDELFIVMEYIEGRELRRVIAEENLSPGRVVNLATQVARGLKAAHSRGIVHRDIKSANIMVTGDDQVKIMDFGLAKVRGETRVTRTGTTMGTPDYMSPEQVRGEDVDHRTDIWSFGVVLYEMLAGQRPFGGDYDQAVMYSILHADPKPLSERRGDLPVAANAVVMKMLARDVTRRYGSMDEIMRDLDSLKGTTPMRTVARAEPVLPSVAVLPFINMSNDPENEFFADGITEDVIAHLAKIKTLRVTSRTSAMAFKKREQGLREIGSLLGVDTIVEGSVRRAGKRVRIVAQLIDPRTDEHLWAETYDRDLDDIFAIQSDVALHIVDALRAELSSADRERLSGRPTEDFAAYELYLQGRHHMSTYTVSGIRMGISLFEKAIARDPGFALAYASIGHAYNHLAIEATQGLNPAEAYSKAEEAVERALAIDNGLSEAHGVVGQLKLVRDFDWNGAEVALRTALRLSPGNSDAYDFLGWVLSAQGRFEDALPLFRKARELDPLAHRSDYANELLRAGRLDEALAEARRVAEAYPDYGRSLGVLAWALILTGNVEEGIATLERTVELTPGNMVFVGQLAQAHARAGNIDRARTVLSDLLEHAKREYVADITFAYAYTGLGEFDKAIEHLERAFEQRSANVYGIKGSYLLAPLRDHPRFQALLRKMNL